MNNPNAEHSVFISYHRKGGGVLAKLVYETLKQKRYRVFFDHESIQSGRFDEKIRKTIREVEDVVVVLSKNSIARCKNKNDWMYREGTEALSAGKNIF